MNKRDINAAQRALERCIRVLNRAAKLPSLRFPQYRTKAFVARARDTLKEALVELQD